MSLFIRQSFVEQFSFNSKNVRAVYIQHVGKCLVACDVYKAMGYDRKAGVKAIQRLVSDKYKMQLRDVDAVLQRVPDHLHPNTVLLKEAGVLEIVTKSRKPQALELAKALGINIHKQKFPSKEQETISIIMQVFKGIKMIDQYTVDNYRIDLYFPKHKLAVECDEFDHADRDIEYEVRRQKYIEEELGCTFIRYNPDAKRFDLFEVINRIIRAIY